METRIMTGMVGVALLMVLALVAVAGIVSPAARKPVGLAAGQPAVSDRPKA